MFVGSAVSLINHFTQKQKLHEMYNGLYLTML